jgi:hypothetical protein|tara:strand:- start:148 stop:261 length:114 start_codon:yes stop_codon:yes gene_type:complete
MAVIDEEGQDITTMSGNAQGNDVGNGRTDINTGEGRR